MAPLDTPEGRAAFIQGILDKVAEMPKATHKRATVISVNDDATLTVHVDGDDPGVTIPTQYLESTVVANDRVLLLFPPKGEVIALGVIQT